MQNIESKDIQRHSSGVGSQSQSGSSSSQDSAKMEDGKQIMHRLGFPGGDYDKDHDVVFKKPPVVVFETRRRFECSA